MLEEAAAAIDILKRPATIARATGGAYVRGTWAGTYDAAVLTAGVLQPVTGRDLRDMPEGVRAEAVKLFFVTASDLLPGDINENDKIEADNETFRVIHIAPWTRYGGFRECVLGRIKAS